MNRQTNDSASTGESAGMGWLMWGIVLAVAGILLVALRLRVADGDSALHIGLVLRLNELPMSRWIAPEWWGNWDLQGLYREHPIGILIPPLLLIKFGFPAAQAPLLANAIYQVLSLVIVQRIAVAVIPPPKARALAWGLQLIPIAFTYRIRANHEQLVLLLFLLALWAAEKSRKDGRWIGLLAFSAAASLLVKGVFAVWIFIACGAWLLMIQDSGQNVGIGSWFERFRSRVLRDRRAWIGLAISFAAVLAVIAGYESLYRQVTHESFLDAYFARQIGTAATANGPSVAVQKMWNLVFYVGRLMWFAFPGSLALLAIIWKRDKRLHVPARTYQAFVFSVGVSLLYVVLFSISDRRADRYIFPAYYLFAAAGLVAAAIHWDWLRRFVERWDRHHQVYTPLLWLILFVLNVASGPAGLPRVDFN